MTTADAAAHRQVPTSPLIEKLGMQFSVVTADLVVGTMPVEGNTQPYGLLHGGASAALLETLGSLGAMAHAGEGRFAVGVDLNITHHRAVKSGTVTGTATPLHRGGTVATYAVSIVDDTGVTVASGRLTCAIRPVQNT